MPPEALSGGNGTRLFKNGAFVEDAWKHVGDHDPIPIEGRAILSLARWRAHQAHIAALGVPIGVRLEAADMLDAVADDIGRLEVIALSFPKFTDGRSYSKARMLREQFGFRGELRAVGEVLLDQVPLMMRCGFDALEISHEPTMRALERGHLPAIALTYQPAGRQQAARRARTSAA
jgi:uncharacterized protein (DUF934 family)